MARRRQSIEIERLTDDGTWKFVSNGWKTHDEARVWIDDNIKPGERLRVVRTVGVYELKRRAVQV